MNRIVLVIVIMLGIAASAEAKWSKSSHRYTRSRSVTSAFQRKNPCPSTGKKYGACPGYVKNHRVPLCKGGPDSVGNLEWQTTAEGKASDKTECR